VVHEALAELEEHDPQAAALVKLRFFSGFEHQQAADILGISRRVADRLWLLARTWLFRMQVSPLFSETMQAKEPLVAALATRQYIRDHVRCHPDPVCH